MKHWSTKLNMTACGAVQSDCYSPREIDCIPCLRAKKDEGYSSAATRLAELEAAKPQRKWHIDAWRAGNCIVCAGPRHAGRVRACQRCWDNIGAEVYKADEAIRAAGHSPHEGLSIQSPSPQPVKPAITPTGAWVDSNGDVRVGNKPMAIVPSMTTPLADLKTAHDHILALVAVIQGMPSSAFDRLSLAKSQRVIKEALECVVPADRKGGSK